MEPLSPTFFALAALAFLLPFATVSCDEARTTFTGVQLVTHTVPQGGTVDEGPDCSSDISACVESRSSGTATVAFVAALIGVVLGLFSVARGPGWFAIVGFGAMTVLPFESDMADVSLHSGYKLAITLFGAACLLHLRRAFARRRERLHARWLEQSKGHPAS